MVFSGDNRLKDLKIQSLKRPKSLKGTKKLTVGDFNHLIGNWYSFPQNNQKFQKKIKKIANIVTHIQMQRLPLVMYFILELSMKSASL